VKRIFNFRNIFIIIISFIGIAYLFGVVGNIRTNKALSYDELLDNQMIVNIAVPTDKFINSKIPKEFLWTYLYISSPLANLQTTIEYTTPQNSFKNFMYGAILPDVISKKIIGMDNLQKFRVVPNRITGAMTVSTCYSSSYLTIGYYGMWIYYFYLLLICFIYSKVLKHCGDYYIPGMAVLSTLFLFSSFDNMFEFSGMSFVLLWPIILTVIKILRKDTKYE
jgi:hypothetical protein